MSNRKISTYTNFLKNISYNPRDIESREVLQLLRQAEAIPQTLFSFKGIIHVIDYTQRRHVAVSGPLKNLCGFSPEEIMESGLDLVISLFHQDDFSIYNEPVFGQTTDFLRRTPQQEHSDYIFTYSYRMKNAEGKWMQLFQQGSYITDPKSGLPLYGIALVADISPLKKDTSIIFSIDKKKNEMGLLKYDNILTNYYYPDPDESRLSRREREILGRMADGLSSKQIAGKLSLSENTISNHRKNMLKKTNAKNVAELIRYASDKGFI